MEKSLEAAAAAPARLAPRQGRGEALRRSLDSGLATLTARAEREAFLVVLFVIYLIGAAHNMPSQVAADTWMMLAYGREIVHHGLPSHDTLTIWAHGRPWVDQQWLGQLLTYGLFTLGGIRAVLAANVLALGAGTGLALVAARRLGGSPRTVTWLALLTFVVIALSSWTARTQSLVFALFVAVLWLLAADSRSPSRRVLLTLPLLVLWANLHGSAVLGALLIALRGGSMLLERSRPLRSRLPIAAALLSSPVLLFASPYGFALVGYYHKLLINPAFGRYLSEWTPTRFGLVTAPFYFVGLLAVWLAGRSAVRLTMFEQGALLALFVSALMANRGVVWFMLSALVLLPAALDGVLASRWGATRYRHTNTIMALAAPVVGVVAVGLSLAHPTSWLTSGFPKTAGERVARMAAADPRVRIFANERFADWLILEHPALAGRVAFDGRFELLTPGELASISHFRGRVAGSTRVTRGYGLLVLDPATQADGHAVSALLADRSRHVRYRGRDLVVISQPSPREGSS